MTKSELREMIRECLREELSKYNLKEGVFDKFKKKAPQPAATPATAQEKEEPKKDNGAFQTYTYNEWLEGVEAAHALYSEHGEYYKNPLWSKAMDIAACENLYKDLVAYMDAWMKHSGSNNFPHKDFAKHLEEDIDPNSLLEGLFGR